ncbi:CBS domain protein sometimes clustered with YjeE [Enhygromyxa salina]|uniref:CBS domain protein sometimes clustered with YjeE n=1 Tax=Enhygromyxa salina TaxID=215803 RepID=A0A0C2CWN4_9BACT|nr:CBS domain-containing protein [Enhygromyxa salina]KIG15456.1 CBS domain protein sometimes clustered with YjeE [Enhygromyxa salina]
MKARDIMVKALTVTPNHSVRALVDLLLQERSDGACVIQDDRLVGVVTTMDLVFQEKRVHLPSILTIMDFAIPLEPPGRLREELDKISGICVDEIMSEEPIVVAPTVPMSDVATLMVEQHLTLVPVVEAGRVLGVVTKEALLRAAFKTKS